MFRVASKNTAKTTPNRSGLFQNGKDSDAFIQPKLNIGKPGDAYEVEADRVADTIVARGNDRGSAFFGPSSKVQRQTQEEDIQEKCAECEKEDAQVQQKPLVETITPLVRRQPDEEQLQEKCAECEKEDSQVQQKPLVETITSLVHRQPDEEQLQEKEGDENIQRKGLLDDRVQEKPDTSVSVPDIQRQEEEIQEKEEDEEVDVQQKREWLQLKDIGTPVVNDSVEGRIQRASGSGQPMGREVKQSMESGFQTDFSGVRVHTGQEASSLNSQLSARAFTHKNNIFFGRDQYQPETNSGKHLLAHELTHVVQQGHAVQRKPEISTQASAPKIQRLGISDALDYFADKAYLIPGFRMFTIILGMNPINMSSVERSAANIMRAIVEFLPGGNLITRVLDKYNVFTDAANLMKDTLDTLSITGQSIKNSIDVFLDSLGWRDIFDLGGVWQRAKRIFTTPINSLINLGKTVLSSIYELVRKAILAPLAQLAQGTRGYDLLKALLGKDPISGEAYPTTPETVIGGFMKLIGQEEVWENIVKGNAVGRAWEWFKGAISGLMAFVFSIPTTIINTIKSLTWEDIIILPKAYLKVAKTFVNIATTYISWGLSTVIGLLEILFSVVAPGVLPYIKKAKGAFTQILKNPVAFIGNLVKAAKLGFQKFAMNIWAHLKKSLLNWLLGSLAGAGIYIPQALEFKEIIKFVASVLGLTWENLRLKLVKHLGEPAVKALETGFELVQLLVTEGPAAAWEKIMEHLGNLKQMVIQEISQFVIVQVVKKAIAKLILSLNPAGAVIQAIIAIYDTITFLIEKIKQIARVGAAIIDSISAIAGGILTQAANKVEETLAGMLTLAISFLAKFAGLGKISEAIIRIINKIREPIDQAMDKVVGWIVNTAKNFLKKGKEKVKGVIKGLLQWWKMKKKVTFSNGEKHTLFFKGSGKQARLFMKSDEISIEDRIKAVADNNERASLQDIYIKKIVTPIEEKAAMNLTDEQQKEFQKQISDALVTLGQALGDTADALPPTAVTYNMIDGKAKKVKALPLTNIPGNTKGSEPKEDPKGWAHVRSFDLGVDRKGTIRVMNWVRFHLLHNLKMHGPGVKWNLVPADGSDNSKYYTSIEDKMVTELDQNENGIYSFEVTVNKYRDKESGADYMEDFPKSLTVKAEELNKDLTAKRPIINDQNFDFNVKPKPSRSPGEAPSVIIADTGRDNLKNFTLLEEAAAKTIAAAGSKSVNLFTQEIMEVASDRTNYEVRLGYLKNIRDSLGDFVREGNVEARVFLFAVNESALIKASLDTKIGDYQSILNSNSHVTLKPVYDSLRSKMPAGKIQEKVQAELSISPRDLRRYVSGASKPHPLVIQQITEYLKKL